MNNINIITPFSYEGLSATKATELQAVTARIKDRLTRQVSDIIDTGCDLIEVKSKLEHGQFENWLTQEFSMTTRTARRFMQAATWAEGKSDTVSVLTPTTIYLLSAPSTPESVAQKVIKAVESGEPAKPDDIRDLIHEVKDQEHQKKTAERDAREPELSSPIEANKPARRMKSRPARWSDAASRAMTALEELQEMQSEYQDWLETLPDNLRESAVTQKLEIITEIDFDGAIETVSAAEDADLPLGFGRD